VWDVSSGNRRVGVGMSFGQMLLRDLGVVGDGHAQLRMWSGSERLVLVVCWTARWGSREWKILLMGQRGNRAFGQLFGK
jgi:hypothetical protein